MNATPEQQAALIAAGVPAALVGLAEFVEPDGSPVAVCDPECGVIAITEDEEGWHSAAWYVGWCSALTPRMGGRRYQYCPQCGTIVGFLLDNSPYRIRYPQVLAALQQAQEERDRFRKVLTKIGDNYGADPVWLARVVLERWHFAEYDSAPEWFQEAALAATEEATDAET